MSGFLRERRRIRTFDRLLRRQVLYPAELCVHYFNNFPLKVLSGWQDSNLRPPAPKAGAITGLRYTPNQTQICICGLPDLNRDTITGLRYTPWQKLSGETGTRTLATVTRRQISNLLHYRSVTYPSSRNVSCFAVANVRQHYISHNYFCAFFNLFLIFFLNLFTIKQIELTKNSYSI